MTRTVLRMDDGEVRSTRKKWSAMKWHTLPDSVFDVNESRSISHPEAPAALRKHASGCSR